MFAGGWNIDGLGSPAAGIGVHRPHRAAVTAAPFSVLHRAIEDGVVASRIRDQRSLSLLMFLGLLGFSLAAWRRDRAGGNLFVGEHRFTVVFAGLWTVSLLSEEAVFVLEYVFHV